MGKKDILLKDYFTPEIFADAINAIVFDGKPVVSPDRMHAIDIETQHIEEDEGTVEADSRFRDKAKVVEVDDAIYCLFAIENQSTDDYSMPLRVMEYDVREYLRQIKESGDGTVAIKPVITIVMYWKGIFRIIKCICLSRLRLMKKTWINSGQNLKMWLRM